mgnify:CR=1 FL=1
MTDPIKPSLRDRLKPLELLIMSAGVAIFIWLVVAGSTREIGIGAIFAGIVFIVTLVILATLAITTKPDEAERLEHFISERFEERIDAKLGRPKFDPHGHCIPALDGRMSKRPSIPLTDLENDGQFVVDSLSDDDPALLKRLKAHDVTPGARLHVTGSGGEELHIQVDGAAKALRLPFSAAGAIRIQSGHGREKINT